MSTLVSLFLVIVVGADYCFGATTPSGISQFFLDDIKALDQIYGKTSDKQLYGEKLPPTISFDFELMKKLKAQESQQKERYAVFENDELSAEDQFQTSFGDRYAQLFDKTRKTEKAKKTKPLQFVGLSKYKPISESTDPHTYNYLKHLEEFENHKYDLSDFKGFKPISPKAEEENAYRNIQDILDAHEANKSNKPESEFNDSLEKFPRHSSKLGDDRYHRYAPNATPTKSKVKFLNNNNLSTRCHSNRCKKRIPHTYRSGSRPYIRKIKRYRLA